MKLVLATRYSASARTLSTSWRRLISSPARLSRSSDFTTPASSPYLEFPVPTLQPAKVPNKRRELTLGQLLQREDRVAADYEAESGATLERELLRTRTEISDRFALPLACLAVSLVAAPLGARARRSGRSYSFAIGFIVFVVYYVLWMAVQPRELVSLAETVSRGLLPNLVLAATGGWLVWRVDRV